LKFASKQFLYVFIFQLIALQLLVAEPSVSQSIENVKISIVLKNASLKDVFSEIEKKTDFVFLYNDNILETDVSFNMEYHKISVSRLLKQLSNDAQLNFKQINDNIGVSKKYGKVPKANNRTHNPTDVNISGKVTVSETEEPLAGVSIRVAGSAIGTITDKDGEYTMSVPDDAEVLIFSYVGYISKEVKINGRSTINIELDVDVTALSEIVVTALGIEKEEKSIGYSVQKIDNDDLTNNNSSNWINALNGKISGMYLTKSTSITSSTRVVLRGESSLNFDKNQALFVVDGVPISNIMTPSAGKGAYSSEPDFGNGISELNPNDIESVSVLKGPGAAALYGSRAANGVVMITTKSASRKKEGVGVSVSSNILFEEVNRWPDYQYEYGAGGVGKHEYYSFGDSEDGPTTANSGYNWGPKFEGQEYVQFGSPVDEDGNRVPIPWKPHPDNIKGFFNTGKTYINTVALSGKGDMGDIRLAYTNMHKKGIVPNNELARNTISLNTGTSFTDKLKLNVVANYINSNSDNITTSGYDGQSGIMYHFIWQERNLDLDWLKDYWVEGKEGLEQNKVFTWASNPYFVVNEVLNGFNKDRLYGNIKASYLINNHFDVMVRAGMDLFNEDRDFRAPFSTNGYPYGYFRTQKINAIEKNYDFLLNYNQQLSTDFNLSLSFGGNHRSQFYDFQEVFAEELAIPEVYSLGNARNRPRTDAYFTDKTVNSLYGFGQLSYRDMLFLDFTGRNDWSSTLPHENNSYFYPSVNMSAVVNEILGIPGHSTLSFAKLRLSWAQVGSDTDPYQLEKTYNYSDLGGAVTNPSTIPNANLKPEISTNYEIGANVRLLDSRLDFDIAAYYTKSKNQILDVPLDISTGFSSRIMNAGLIVNKGLELSLRARPITSNDGLNWSVFANWSANRNEVRELGENISTYLLATAPGANVEAREGEPFGNIYGRKFLRAPDGQIVYKDGIPQWTDDFHLVGNYNPDWVAGIGNEFSYKNFSLSFLFDGRKGGDIYSLTHATTAASGGFKKTLPHRYDGVVGDGVMLNDNGVYVPNTVRIDAPTYWRGIYRRFNAETNTIDASFIKLREFRLAYTLPASFLERIFIQSASVALVGRDLFVWTDWPIFDPEASDIDGGTITPGIERAQFPSTRSYGLNINFKF